MFFLKKIKDFFKLIFKTLKKSLKKPAQIISDESQNDPLIKFNTTLSNVVRLARDQPGVMNTVSFELVLLEVDVLGTIVKLLDGRQANCM